MTTDSASRHVLGVTLRNEVAYAMFAYVTPAAQRSFRARPMAAEPGAWCSSLRRHAISTSACVRTDMGPRAQDRVVDRAGTANRTEHNTGILKAMTFAVASRGPYMCSIVRW